MLNLGLFAFAQPWLLLALAGLPMLWLLLRITPPAPRSLTFPAIRLLVGLKPPEETPARTPLWLVLLRMVIAALIIFGLAQPILYPARQLAGTGPLVLVVDDGWAAARNWPARTAALEPSPCLGRRHLARGDGGLGAGQRSGGRGGRGQNDHRPGRALGVVQQNHHRRRARWPV